MTGFNLLPWRDALRRERRRQFRSLLGLAGALGMAVVLAVFVFNERRLAQMADRHDLLSVQIGVLDARISEIRMLREKITALMARRDAVRDLQRARGAPVRFLDELVNRVPQGVMLKSVQQAERITLAGFAQSGARVSELLHALARSASVGQPELVEIKSATLGQGREARRLFEFTIVMDAPGFAQQAR